MSPNIWVRSWNCSCLVTWFCYQLIAKPGNKSAAVSWPNPYIHLTHLPLVPHMCEWMSSLVQIMVCRHIWRQAIITTNGWLLSIRSLGTNFSEILIKIQIFSFMKIHLNISSAKWQPFCPGGDELNQNKSLLWFNSWMLQNLAYAQQMASLRLLHYLKFILFINLILLQIS